MRLACVWRARRVRNGNFSSTTYRDRTPERGVRLLVVRSRNPVSSSVISIYLEKKWTSRYIHSTSLAA
jgi:hypothetical protein